MTLVIQNADSNLLAMLNAINQMRSIPYNYFQDNEFSNEVVDSVLAGEEELRHHQANGTLETFACAQDAFASIV